MDTGGYIGFRAVYTSGSEQVKRPHYFELELDSRMRVHVLGEGGLMDSGLYQEGSGGK